MADSSFDKMTTKLDEWSKFKVGKRYERRTYLDVFLTAGVALTSIPLTVFGIISIVGQDYFGASYWFLAIAVTVAILMFIKITSRKSLINAGELNFVVLDIVTGPSGALDYLVKFDNGQVRNLIEYDKSKEAAAARAAAVVPDF